jgi:hypothetical protein
VVTIYLFHNREINKSGPWIGIWLASLRNTQGNCFSEGRLWQSLWAVKGEFEVAK